MHLPIRWRLTAAYVITAAVLTTIGAVVFGASVHTGLDHRLDGQLKSRAERLAGGISRDGPASVHIQTPSTSDMQIALIDPTGQVFRVSPGLSGTTLLDAGQLAASRGSGQYWTVGPGPDYRLFAAPALRPDGTWVVTVATPLAVQNALTASVTSALVLAALAVVVLGAAGAWALAVVALRPVERLRREVAAVSESDPGGPVRIPPTGDEIARLAETMNGLLARIGSGLAHQRQFVADASHELRNPLAVIQTNADVALQEEGVSDDVRRRL
jgi:hypothetical protein